MAVVQHGNSPARYELVVERALMAAIEGGSTAFDRVERTESCSRNETHTECELSLQPGGATQTTPRSLRTLPR
jgi:hypothetical protein